MNVVTEHVARFGLPVEVVHAMLAEIEEQYEVGATDLDIALRIAATVPGSPYAARDVVAEVTDLLEREEIAAEV